MLNFSIGNGTSGHLIGGAIVAILLGPEAAVLVLSSVLLIQTFVFADGGILALGANILLMGIMSMPVVEIQKTQLSCKISKKNMKINYRLLD